METEETFNTGCFSFLSRSVSFPFVNESTVAEGKMRYKVNESLPPTTLLLQFSSAKFDFSPPPFPNKRRAVKIYLEVRKERPTSPRGRAVIHHFAKRLAVAAAAAAVADRPDGLARQTSLSRSHLLRVAR